MRYVIIQKHISLLKITSHFLSILPELCDVILCCYLNQTRKVQTPTEKWDLFLKRNILSVPSGAVFPHHI